MEHKLTDKQLETLKQVRESSDKVIYHLGLNCLQQYDLFNELSKVNMMNQEINQEILTEYGEGELKISDGIFVTKE